VSVLKQSDHYVKLERGDRRFMRLNANDKVTHCLRYVPCLGWRKDKGKGTGPCW
jgi:hypothetical protein